MTGKEVGRDFLALAPTFTGGSNVPICPSREDIARVRMLTRTLSKEDSDENWGGWKSNGYVEPVQQKTNEYDDKKQSWPQNQPWYDAHSSGGWSYRDYMDDGVSTHSGGSSYPSVSDSSWEPMSWDSAEVPNGQPDPNADFDLEGELERAFDEVDSAEGLAAKVQNTLGKRDEKLLSMCEKALRTGDIPDALDLKVRRDNPQEIRGSTKFTKKLKLKFIQDYPAPIERMEVSPNYKYPPCETVRHRSTPLQHLYDTFAITLRHCAEHRLLLNTCYPP